MTTRPKFGAYVLAADTTWIQSSLRRYYPLLDVLIISLPEDGKGWTGAPVESAACLQILRTIDTRGIAQIVTGRWTDARNPSDADTRQRKAAIAALVPYNLDWILQIDTDEVLPNADALIRAVNEAANEDAVAVEWPMRVLFRKIKNGRYVEVVAGDGSPRYDYPGPIAVRPNVTLVDCRRTSGRVLRPTVYGDTRSLQIVRPAAAGEVRMALLRPADAIVHNSWARSPVAVHRKVSSWGHNEGLRTTLYYWAIWLPSRFTWRLL